MSQSLLRFHPFTISRSLLNSLSSQAKPPLTIHCNRHVWICGTPPAPSRLTGKLRTSGARDFHFNCCHNETPESSSSQDEQGPPQEVVLKAISEVSKTEGRVGQTTNVVIGGTVTDDSTREWLALDQKVNSYPTVRGFTAIGTGGDDFVQAMVVAVESVIQQPIPEGHVRQKLSSRGKYVSVNIGPVQVVSSEQVQAVYNAMRRDDRMKYFL
uniref:Phosphoribosylformylglycinamidine synthase n=1 Tax=Cannabis sativa TaxID=3483 RepID=A0A803PHT6_CANSA